MEKMYKNAGLIVVHLLFCAGSHYVFAQNRVISGIVQDESGSPMPGVNVLVSGTTNGTVTDISGKYSLPVDTGAKLSFSFIGYTPQEVEVGSNTVVNVSLMADITELAEIVVTGYASQEKKDLTGSVGTVKVADLTRIPSSNITNQLQGRVAGVTVSGDGRPGQPAKVRIRGMGSFLNNDPLYVVDGVPTQDISTVNPNDIESLTVLKDAGAASIYGSRASNGVIIVTTKKGTRKGIKVNYDMYYGVQDPGKGPDFLANTQEFANLQWLVYKNDQLDGTVDLNPVNGIPDSETHPTYGSSANPSPAIPSWAADTDWYKAMTRNAIIQNHDLSLSGGNENANFYAGLNYFDQEGIVIENFSKRFSARLNSEFKIKDRITIGENLTITGRSGLGINGNGSEFSPVAEVYKIQPIIPAIVTQTIPGISRTFQPGEYGGTGIAQRLGLGANQLAVQARNADDRNQDIRLLGSLFADIKILDFLSFRTTFGGTYQSGYNTDWIGTTYESTENISTANYTESSFFGSDWVWTNSLTFNKTFGDHKILAVGGYEAVKYGIGRFVSATRAGYLSEAFSFRTVANGSLITSATSSLGTPTTLVSTFIRADYSFKDKYLFSATVRRDGSSVFGADTRYGVFPSFSGGWRISEENFMAGLDFLSDLKIRGGYGSMGNQLAVSPFNQFFLFGGETSSSNYDLTGTGTSSQQGFRPTQIGNPDAKWETNTTINVGLDAGLFDNKLQLTLDWYSKETTDLLYNPPVAGTAGAASAPFVNIAEMKNTGVDVLVGYKKIVSSDWSVDATLTLTTYKNEIKRIAEGLNYFDAGGSRIGGFNRNQVGGPMSQFFGYQVDGLWQTQDEIEAANVADGDENTLFQTGAEPGFFRYADIDASGVIDDQDRTPIGNPNPDFTYGLNLGVNYKSFDFSVFFYGSQGNEIFNYNRWWLDFWPSFQGQKSTDLLYNSWTPTNTGATTPKASNKSNLSTNTVSNSYYVEDGSFLRLKSIQIGYNLPPSLISKIGLTKARVYAQGVNLFTITDYTGLDPDLNTNDDRYFGVDQGAFPLVKQYTVGLSIGL